MNRETLTQQLEAQRGRISEAMACVAVVRASLPQDEEYNRRTVLELAYRTLDEVAGQLDPAVFLQED
jgi:hypothetical protein